MEVERVITDRWRAKLQVRGENARGWIGYGDTPTLAVARLVAEVGEYQAALTAATGGQDE